MASAPPNTGGERRAVIFDVQRASTHDGPGLRTTVFFKGCNLRCLWCHNPESWCAEPQMQFIKDRCTGCGLCDEGCLFGARTLVGRGMCAREVVDKVSIDAPFYASSGGGVTFSGGEPMLRAEFLADVLERCRDLGIHTAVDTAGDVPWALFEAVMPLVNLFLFDIKCDDEALHMKVTGVRNGRIKENLLRLIAAGKSVTVRVPVIPGINDSGSELLAMAAFLREAHPEKVELLPYHKLGARKYEMLGMEDQTAHISPLSDAELAHIRRAYQWQ